MSEIHYWSACRMARAISAGKLGSREAVEACLARIEAVNPAINAVVQQVVERARAEADERDREARAGQSRGPLHGVPFTVKDSLDTEGIVSTGGTLGRREFVPAADAPVVARLRAAGAVLLGKTNTPELTFSAETNNLIYGRSNNPYDLERSPGGSSGASAAIVACGGAALELGSDTGGSIREPAHLCGIAGIKPTSGRTPRSGHIVPPGGVIDSLTQIGPMARYVEDLALALPLICGPDGVDPAAVPAPLGDPGDVDVPALRVAWYDDNGIVTPMDEIRRTVGDTARALEKAGLVVEEKLLPETRLLVDLITEFRETTNAGYILRLVERYGSEQISEELEGYLTEKSLASTNRLDPDLMEAIDAAKSRALAFFADFDAIVCPPSFAVARPHRASYTDGFDEWGYIQIFNLLGWPGLSLRAGSTADGLPVGVQVVSAPWREDIALALGQRIETLMEGFRPPPI